MRALTDRCSRRPSPMAAAPHVVLVGAFSVDIGQKLRALGARVTHVATAAALERWPVDAIVATDPAHYTPFWKESGAACVLIVGDGQLLESDATGAEMWLMGAGAPMTLVRVVQSLLSSAIAA